MTPVCPNNAAMPGYPTRFRARRVASLLVPSARHLDPRTERRSFPVSYILFDALLPYLGPEAASYWAHLLVIYPI